ncbi:PEP-CTERM sorting domain-containing protein [Zoogloeaceae bacterium G21618-S1]|nr:PEP-CTERM sorting domain-containing protein [Zoogloeaceae bacterium G21618-S1]
MKKKLLASAAVALTVSATPAFALPGFDIVINFLGTGDTQPTWGTGTPTDFSQIQKDAFESAAQFWESKISGYQGSISIPTFTITAAFAPEDGEFNSLAYAAPDATLTQDGYTLPTTGYMQFDAQDWGPGDTPFTRGELLLQEFIDSVQHEMAHALGFGTLFTDNGVATGNQYTGALAVAAFNQEFGQNASSILLENGGGHWSECWRAQANGNQNCIDDQNDPNATNDLELMTPYAVANATFSNTTLAAFQDIGYATVSPVPEPETWLMMLTGLAGLGAVSRRRRAV